MATIGRLVKRRDSVEDSVEAEAAERARIKAAEKAKERMQAEEKQKEEAEKIEKEKPAWGSKGVWAATEYGAEQLAEDDASPITSRRGKSAPSLGAYPTQEANGSANKQQAAKKAPSVPLSAWAPSTIDQSSMSAKDVIARAAAGAAGAAEAAPYAHASAHASPAPSMGAVIELLAEQLRAERERSQAAEAKVGELEKKNEDLEARLHEAQAAAIVRLERENERLSRLQSTK